MSNLLKGKDFLVQDLCKDLPVKFNVQHFCVLFSFVPGGRFHSDQKTTTLDIQIRIKLFYISFIFLTILLDIMLSKYCKSPGYVLGDYLKLKRNCNCPFVSIMLCNFIGHFEKKNSVCFYYLLRLILHCKF